MPAKRTIHQRIRDAAKAGRGIRLSADEVQDLVYLDAAIEDAAFAADYAEHVDCKLCSGSGDAPKTKRSRRPNE